MPQEKETPPTNTPKDLTEEERKKFNADLQHLRENLRLFGNKPDVTMQRIKNMLEQ